MRFSFIALPLVLAACSRSESDLSEIKEQLEVLTLEIAEIKQRPTVTSEALEITDKLAEEVARLRRTVGALSAPPGTPTPSELHWVQSEIEVDGKKRTVLCLYRAQNDRKGAFDLVGVRLIDYDMQIVEWPRQVPSVLEIKKQVEDAQKKEREKDNP